MSVPPNLKIGIPLIGKLEAPLSLDETSPHASALLIHYSTFGGLAPALPAPPAHPPLPRIKPSLYYYVAAWPAYAPLIGYDNNYMLQLNFLILPSSFHELPQSPFSFKVNS